MGIKARNYTHTPGFTEDFHRVRNFLIRIHEPGYTDQNWLWARWEYMFSHPALDENNLSRIGIWEDGGEIVALASYEGSLGEAFFSFDRQYSHLRTDMMEYALQNLIGEEGGIRVLLNEDDTEFARIALSLGLEPTEYTEPMSVYILSNRLPEILLPEGYSLVSLAEENDLSKINQVLWRGFNHEGDAPHEDIENRKKMQSGPSFRKDLTIAVKAPNGEFASFCGMWYEEGTDYAYVEPVATNPDYRKLGLGRAAVLEGVRRCQELGATVAYVGSAQQFYRKIGFKPLFSGRWWKKGSSI